MPTSPAQASVDATANQPSLRSKTVAHRCIRCGREYPHSYTTLCDCGHLIDVFYDLENARLYDSSNPYIRYFDLLPIENPDNLLPVDQELTPCIHAVKLGAELGLPNLYLKNETVLPTGTTKDRMAIVALSYMREVGVRAFAASSTGNSSSAFAHYISLYPECDLYLFAGEEFLRRLAFTAGDQLQVYAMRDATFVEACEEAKAYANRKGLVAERGFFNPGRREGLKTALLECLQQVPQTVDWYVQAISSAMGVYGCYKGCRELQQMGEIERLPRLMCIQQDTNAPMVTAFEAGSDVIRPQDIVARPYGLAEAILRGDPSRVYPYINEIVKDSNGLIMAVSEADIREARQMINELEGIDPCFTASTAVAGLIKSARNDRVPKDDTVVISITGRDRTDGPDASAVTWLQRDGNNGWVPEDPAAPMAVDYREAAM